MRRRDREVTEHSEIMHILDSGKVLHLGLVDQGKPYIVPMNYGYVFEGEKLVFYLHGALEGRKLDIIRNNSDCCVQIECDVQSFSGKVACQYGCSYYSFDGFGTAKIVEAVRESVIMSLMVRLNELLPGDTIDLSSLVHDFMHKTNTVLFVETDWFEKSVYESIFLDELVYRYTMMYDEKAPMTRVIMDEASLCFYDARLFCVEARRFKLSVDFIYQSITNLKMQHPDDYNTVLFNAIAIVCLGTNDKPTIEFLTEAAGITTEDAKSSLNYMIDLRVMPHEDELILCPTLDKDPIVARKIRF